jgi:hypothetical protein
LNVLLWNGVNLLIVGWLLLRRRDAGGQPVAQTA